VDHLDLDHRLVVVNQQVVDTGRGLVVGEPKTTRGERLLPLDGTAVAILRGHRARQDAERAEWAEAYDDSGYVFTREDGRVLRPEYVTRRFQRLAADFGQPVIKLHEMRHTNASIGLDLGLQIKVISERLGHSTTSFTADSYTHVLPTRGWDAAEAFGAALDGTAPRNGSDGGWQRNGSEFGGREDDEPS
jgi:integrase